MSTGMKVQMICNPPPCLDKASVIRAILDLPHKERNVLIKKTPSTQLKKLLLSLPKDTQRSFYSALQQSVAANKNNKSKKELKDRDRKLQQALNSNPSNNGISAKHNKPTSQINVGRRKKSKYSSHLKMRKNIEKFSKVNAKNVELEKVIKDIDAISDNGDDHDRCFERCCKHINYRQFYEGNKEDPFLHSVRKMMRSFGDGPRPSRYAALIVLNHIKSYLLCIIDKLEEYEKENNIKGSKVSNKSGRRRLDIFEKWFPAQVKPFKKWKYFKYEAKKDEKKVPDLVNNENDEDSDIEEDAV